MCITIQIFRNLYHKTRRDLSVWVVCLGFLLCPTMKCSINLSPITVCRKMSHKKTYNYVSVWFALHVIKLQVVRTFKWDSVSTHTQGSWQYDKSKLSVFRKSMFTKYILTYAIWTSSSKWAISLEGSKIMIHLESSKTGHTKTKKFYHNLKSDSLDF